MVEKISFKDKIFVNLYYSLNDLKNQWLFEVLSWLFINFLKLLWILSFILGLIFLVIKDYNLSLKFFILWVLFFISDRYFSIQRAFLVTVDIESLIKKLKIKKYERITYKIQNELIKDIGSLLQADITEDEKQTKEDITNLLTYLKYFVVYKDYRNIGNLNQLRKFLNKLRDIFSNRDYSQIFHVIIEDYENFKKKKEFKYLIKKHNLKSNHILDILKEIIKEKKPSFGTKSYKWIIKILKIFDTYYKAILLILFILFAYLLITGKIDLQTFSHLNPIG